MTLALLAALVGAWLGPPPLDAGPGEPPRLEPPALALAWSAPEACPQRDELDARLHALLPELGPVAAPDQPAPLRVEGQISLAGPDRWAVELRFFGDRGVDTRELAGPDCRALTDAVALVIAVGLDPVGVSTTLAAAPEPSPEPSPEPKPEPKPQPSPAPESDSEPRAPGEVRLADEPEPALDLQAEPEPDQRREPIPLRLALAALGGGGYGPLDLGVGQVGGELALLGRRWRVGVRGTWLAPRTRARTDPGSGSVTGEARYTGFGLAARGCGVPEAGGVELPICAGIAAGSLRGEGVGATPDPRRGAIPWVAAVVGPGLRWAPIPRVALALDLELLVPLTRGGFRIGDAIAADVVPAGVQAFAGVELRLP